MNTFELIILEARVKLNISLAKQAFARGAFEESAWHINRARAIRDEGKN